MTRNRSHSPIPASPDVLRMLTSRPAEDALTRREVAVLELVGQGLSNRDIAAALGIAHETVKVHVKNILRKLGVINRTAAVMTALKRGILHVI